MFPAPLSVLAIRKGVFELPKGVITAQTPAAKISQLKEKNSHFGGQGGPKQTLGKMGLKGSFEGMGTL